MENETIQVRMNGTLVKKIDVCVKHGLFDNRSEVVRDAVRQMFSPELKPEVLAECMKISEGMRKGKKMSLEDLEKELLE
ncbi:MAG: ribbon-helix-helix domain-containing protein [archaeon]